MKRVPKKKNDKGLSQEDIKKFSRRIWLLVLLVLFAGVIFILSVRVGVFGPLPTFEDLENPKSNLASEIISEDNKVLGTYFVHNRSNVKYQELSPSLVHALVATEDKRFYRHSGIDYWRTVTVVFHTLAGNKQGGSTITQQLALNLFSEGRARNFYKRVLQKFQEWITAVRLERNYTKEEIITMYFNTVDFGAYNTFGIKSAARTYFNTTPDQLTPEQSALLVGMLKGPGIYSPVRYPENAIKRRNTVLNGMVRQGFLTKSDAEGFKELPLGLKLNITRHTGGFAPYFRAVLKNELRSEFKRLSITKPDGTPYDLDRDGLKIYTPINYKMQQHAEEAQKVWMKQMQERFDRQWQRSDAFAGKNANLLTTGMKRSDRYRELKSAGYSEDQIVEEFKKPVPMSIFTWEGTKDTVMSPIDSIRYNKLILRNSLMAMDPNTGNIKAWVGGIDFEHYKYDQVKMGTRQVGSTAKPFTYAAAIDIGWYSPCHTLPNHSQTYNGWTPRGTANGGDPITMKNALRLSQNFASAYLIHEIGAEAVANLTKQMGITSPVPSYPSISLGAYEASVYDMVGAYSTFVNNGTWIEPIMVLRVEDKNGTPIYEKAPKITKILNSESAYIMVDMLKGVVDGGTGSRLRRAPFNFTNPMGGKTGTTNGNADAWFLGITPDLVTGVWTGAEDRNISFYSMADGQGATAALPVYGYFMKMVYEDPELNISKDDFALPPGGLTRELDCSKYTPFYGTDEPDIDDNRLGF